MKLSLRHIVSIKHRNISFLKSFYGNMRYYKITNADGKSWLLPKRNMQIGLMLYQPSSKKGKLLKRLFPLLSWIPLIRKLLHVEFCNFPFDKRIDDYLHDVFKSSYLEYAIFMGTPCKNQKATIQISCNGKILGYCKVTKNKEIYKLFETEKQTLDYLNSVRISNVPVCLDCSAIDNLYFTFVQTTFKTLNSSVTHKLSEKHYRFVEDLATKTKVRIDYKKSDFGKMIQSLSLHLSDFEYSDRNSLKKAIKIINEFYKDKKQFSFYHADFTPWNTFEEKGKLFVFDFEYSSRSCPSYMDLFHFFGQVGILENKKSVNELYKEYLQNVPTLLKYTAQPHILYISYLLYVFTFYCQMFNWHFPKEDIGYKSWIGQLKLILKQQYES